MRDRPGNTPDSELVDDANEAVSRAESIRGFVIVPEEFTEGNVLLTPSLKVKRHAVAAAYEREIEGVYATW